MTSTSEGPNPSGFCMCGCGQKTPIAKRNRKNGDVKGQPVRFVKNHTWRVSVGERFWSKVEIGAPDECWPWTGAKTKGYGSLRVGDHAVYAHRLAYELTYGPIPEGRGFHGTVAMHTCDNPACCNPGHIVIGTQEENLRDMSAKCRGRNQSGPQRRPGGRPACAPSA
ncbi:MAG: HNH endonuclease [Spirochaetales bacterium]|nr:HNH endonuclease [Spirochaetales bacterium]